MARFKSTSLLYALSIMMVLIGCSDTEQEPTDEENNQQDDTAEAPQETDLDYNGDGGYLWKVTNEETTAYIMGSIHLGHEDFYPLAPEIEDAYQSADVILPEINMFEVDMSEEEINEMALFDDETTLDQLLSEEAYSKLATIFETNGIAIEDFHDYQPWFIESLLSELIQAESDQQAEYGVDLHFLQRAIEDDKEIVELETIEDQYDMLTGFPLNLQVNTLEQYVAAYEEQAGWLNELSYNWIHGNEESSQDRFVKMMSESFDAADETFKYEMNDRRNIDMANTIDDLLQQNSGQTYFAIVGTAHVVVEPAIPSELEKKGYDVERIY